MRGKCNWWWEGMVLSLSVFLWACGGWSPPSRGGDEIDLVVRELVGPLGEQVGEEQVSWLGFRESDGKSS
ncbi:MAG: hypothetical protein HOC74_05760, partial [Gemmatimonadetes bacterium]|nr:hypothetical protein [Gemmatimonadota bacterium]